MKKNSSKRSNTTRLYTLHKVVEIVLIILSTQIDQICWELNIIVTEDRLDENASCDSILKYKSQSIDFEELCYVIIPGYLEWIAPNLLAEWYDLCTLHRCKRWHENDFLIHYAERKCVFIECLQSNFFQIFTFCFLQNYFSLLDEIYLCIMQRHV